MRGGRSLDTSMGFGPLAALVMGARSGDVDPSVLLYLLGPLGYTTKQITDLLDTESGMLGLTGASDMRDIGAALAAGDGRAALAYDLYAYRIRQYIGAYAAVLNGLDGIVFTAGVGENDALVRSKVCHNMESFGLALDEAKNKEHTPGLRELNQSEGRVKILVIPTAEELEIAQQCAVLCGTAH
ncbi:hypothetical protein [Hymenobacter coccineus]|uniref:hypothetical protein n=1 Tax=Hymenobacter coccineus TaxID=1908235 RepID=UPI0021CD4C89|nr:hypothetical protein [Hymenobacter coccineus]